MRSLALGATLALCLSLSSPAQVGALVGRFPTPPGFVPAGLGSSPAGELLLTTSNGTVFRLDTSGNVLGSFSVAATSGLANGITSDGVHYYVTDSSALTGGRGVDVYDLQGNPVRSFPVPATFPAGICWSPTSNHLFVVDRVGGNVREFDLPGNAIATFPLNGTSSDGIAFDVAANGFWVYEVGGDLCRNYDAAFTELRNFPGPGAAVGAAGRGAALVGGILFVVVPSAREIAMFDATGTLASVASYGRGCPREPTVYEQFAAGSFDLSNRSFRFTPNGRGGWAVTACTSACFDTNLGTALSLGDDQLSTNHALGFSFPMPGSPHGATTAVDVSSNGFVYLRSGVTQNHGCCDGDPSALVAGPERISALWMDLDPSSGGSVHFRSSPTSAVITWWRVLEISTRSANTAQVQLFPNGEFLLSYQTATNLNHALLAGYSSGNGAYDPGSTDLSASLPFSTGINGPRLQLASDRPVLGTQITFRLTQLPAGASLAALLFGSAQAATPLDALGMTGCTLWTTADLATAPLSLPAGTFRLGVPSAPSLVGAQIFEQAVGFVAGQNAFGAITSNGLALKLGT